jgi:uncharacterized protein YoxC
MVNLVYISVVIIAIAFLVLVIFVSKTLKTFQTTLMSVTATIDSLEKQLKDVTTETTQLIHHTNDLTMDLQKKVEGLNSVVHALKETGATVQKFNQSMNKVQSRVTTQVEKNQEKVSQVIQWGSTFIEIWDKWKEKKKKHKHESVEGVDAK